MNVWDAIRQKRAVRHFTEQALSDEVVYRILDAGRRAQSAKNSQPWHFIAIRDKARLTELASTGQWVGHVAGAALCVTLLTPVPDERFAWYMFDIGQAAAYMQLAAFEMGVASCLGTVYDKDAARNLLKFPADKDLNLLISFGYPAQVAPPAKKSGRRGFDEVIHWETW